MYLPAILTVLCAAAAAADYTFTLNGSSLTPTLLPTGNGPHPGPGDLVWTGGWQVLDGPGRYSFSDERDQVRRRIDDGPETVTLVRISSHSEDSDQKEGKTSWKLVNALAGMDAAQRAAVRGLILENRYDAPIDGLAATCSGLNWGHLAVSVSDDAWLDPQGRLPFDRGIWALTIKPNQYPNRFTQVAIDCYAGLRFLSVDGLGSNDLPIALASFASYTQLRVLRLSSVTVAPGPLQTALLSNFEAWHCKTGAAPWPVSLDDLAACTKLSVINVAGAGLTGLEKLDRFPVLEKLTASNSRIARLSTTVGPNLRKISVFGAPIPPDLVATFRASHPNIVLEHAWADALTPMQSCTRIILRTGGTCHRDRGSERELWRSNEPAEVRRFLSLIGIKDRQSGSHCMCCGSATVELYRGEVLAMTVGMHHGQSLRWADGPWPGDAILTEDAATTLADWLAERGEQNTVAEYKQGKEREAAMKRFVESWTVILGAPTMDAMRGGKDQAGVRAALAAGLPEGPARDVTLLRLYGCCLPDWHLHTYLDRILVGSEDEKEGGLLDLASALRGLTAPNLDTTAQLGAARLILGDRALDRMSTEDAARLVPALARLGFADPRPENRQETIQALATANAPWRRALLREALADPPAGLLPESAATLPGGMVTYRSSVKVPNGATLSAAAALALLHLGDRDAEPLIRAAMSRMDKDGRAAVSAALDGAKAP